MKATKSEVPSLVTLFSATVAQCPDATSVIEDDQVLSYQALEVFSAQVALFLRSRGCQRGSVVGVLMDRSLAAVVASIGIWKAGGVLLPLAREHPHERLRFVLEDSAATIVLTDREPIATELTDSGKVHFIWQIVSRAGLVAPAKDRSFGLDIPDPGDLAYLTYLSGSTGRPQGVEVPHTGVHSLIKWMVQQGLCRSSDVVAQSMALSTDFSLLEMLLPLAVGGTLVFPRPEGRVDADTLVSELQRRGVSVLCVMPSLLRHILAAAAPGTLDSLRVVILGGEPVPQELVDRLFSAVESEKLAVYSVYGPTEASVVATIWPCERDRVQNVVPIGREVPGTRILLLDRQFRQVGAGEIGEIFISGPRLARGYIGSPALTASRFLPTISGIEGLGEGARMYRTGDLGREQDVGVFEYLGRAQQQVKVRGFRVELVEIEALLTRHSEIQEAVVIARADLDEETKTLVAYVVPRKDRAMDPSLLRAYLSERLPDYMVPARIVTMLELPFTPSGKVDRRALPAPEAEPRRLQEPATLPTRPLEEWLVRLWEEVLEISEIGVEDDFFALGGNDIQAMTVITRIRETWGRRFAYNDFEDKPTVRALANLIEPPAQEPSRPIAPPIFQEARLREAYLFREFLGGMMAEDWLGLEILCTLTHFARTSVERLVSLTGRGIDELVPVLTQLAKVEAVSVGEGGFSCTQRGAEAIRRMSEATGLDLRQAVMKGTRWDSTNG